MEETQYQVYVIRNEENRHYIGLSEAGLTGWFLETIPFRAQ